MKRAIIALTRNGVNLGLRLVDKLEGQIELYLPERFRFNEKDFAGPGKGIHYFNLPLNTLVGDLFTRFSGLVFIMAAGIVVRLLAPYLGSKNIDPAVVVVDERGKFAVSLLSGHWGGANELAREVAGATGAQPVVTTATDVNGLPAVDVWARKMGMEIEPFSRAKDINAVTVNGGRVAVFVDPGLGKIPLFGEECYKIPFGGEILQLIDERGWEIKSLGEIKQLDLERVRLDSKRWGALVFITSRVMEIDEDIPYVFLRPRNVIAGIGCRKGVKQDAVRRAIFDALEKSGRSPMSLKLIATVNLKKAEPALRETAEELGVPLLFYSVEELAAVAGEFSYSEFVQKAVGVGSICERAAVLGGKKPKLILPKMKFPGVTVALAEEKFL